MGMFSRWRGTRQSKLASRLFRYHKGAKKRIFLHIGLHKTGSSAIQKSLHESRALLKTHGILYPDLGVNHSHRIVSAFCNNPESYHLNIRRGISGPYLDEFNLNTRQRLQVALNAPEFDSIVLSGEGMGWLPTEGVQALRKACEGRDRQFRLIAYLRDAPSMIASVIQERVKHGGELPADVTDDAWLGYRRWLDSYIEVFGKDSFVFKKYEPASTTPDELLSGFFSAIEHPEISGVVTPVRTNLSLSAPAVHILDAYNRLFPLYADSTTRREFNPDRVEARGIKGPVAWLRGVGGPVFSVDPELIEGIVRENREEIAWAEELSGEVLQIGSAGQHVELGYDTKWLEELARLLHELMWADVRSDTKAAKDAAKALLAVCNGEFELGSRIGRYA